MSNSDRLQCPKVGLGGEDAPAGAIKPLPISALSFTMFQLLELLGYGYFIDKQAVYTLPIGAEVSTITNVPSNEVWFAVETKFSGFPSDTALYTFSTDNQTYENALLITEELDQFISTSVRRANKLINATIKNVTGDPTYNILPAQALTIRYDLLVFKTYPKYADLLAKTIKKIVDWM